MAPGVGTPIVYIQGSRSAPSSHLPSRSRRTSKRQRQGSGSPDPLLLDDSSSNPSIVNTSPADPGALVPSRRGSQTTPPAPSSTDRPKKRTRLCVEIPAPARKAEPVGEGGGGEGSRKKGKTGRGKARSKSLSLAAPRPATRRSARHSAAGPVSSSDIPTDPPLDRGASPQPLGAPSTEASSINTLPTPVTPSHPLLSTRLLSPDTDDEDSAPLAQISPPKPIFSATPHILRVLSPDSVEKTLPHPLNPRPQTPPPATLLPSSQRQLSPDTEDEDGPIPTPTSQPPVHPNPTPTLAVAFEPRHVSPDSDEEAVESQIALPDLPEPAPTQVLGPKRELSPDTEEEVALPPQAELHLLSQTSRILSPDSDEEQPLPLATTPIHVDSVASQPPSSPLTPLSSQADPTPPRTRAKPQELIVETESTPPPGPTLSHVESTSPAGIIGLKEVEEEARLSAHSSPIHSSSEPILPITAPASPSPADEPGPHSFSIEEFRRISPAACIPPQDIDTVTDLETDIEVEVSGPISTEAGEGASTFAVPLLPQYPAQVPGADRSSAPPAYRSVSPAFPTSSTVYPIVPTTAALPETAPISPNQSTTRSSFSVDIDLPKPKPRRSLSTIAPPAKAAVPAPAPTRASTRTRFKSSRYSPSPQTPALPPVEPTSAEMVHSRQRSKHRIDSPPESAPASRSASAAPPPSAPAPPAPAEASSSSTTIESKRRDSVAASNRSATLSPAPPSPFKPKKVPAEKPQTIKLKAPSVTGEKKGKGKETAAPAAASSSEKKGKEKATASVPAPAPAPAPGRRSGRREKAEDPPAPEIPKKRSSPAAESGDAKRKKKDKKVQAAANALMDEDEDDEADEKHEAEAPKAKAASHKGEKRKDKGDEASTSEASKPRILLKLAKQLSASEVPPASAAPSEGSSSKQWAVKRPSGSSKAGSEAPVEPNATVKEADLQQTGGKEEKSKKRKSTGGGEAEKPVKPSARENREPRERRDTRGKHGEEKAQAGPSVPVAPISEPPAPAPESRNVDVDGDIIMTDTSALTTLPAPIPHPTVAALSTPIAPSSAPTAETPPPHKKDPHTSTPSTGVRRKVKRVDSPSPEAPAPAPGPQTAAEFAPAPPESTTPAVAPIPVQQPTPLPPPHQDPTPPPATAPTPPGDSAIDAEAEASEAAVGKSKEKARKETEEKGRKEKTKEKEKEKKSVLKNFQEKDAGARKSSGTASGGGERSTKSGKGESSTPKVKGKTTAPPTANTTPAGTPVPAPTPAVRTGRAAAVAALSGGGDSAAGTPSGGNRATPGVKKAGPTGTPGVGKSKAPVTAAPAAAKSLLASTFAQLNKTTTAGTPGKADGDGKKGKKEMPKIEKQPRGYSFVYTPTPEEKAMYDSLAGERQAARERWAAQAKNGLNLNFARDSYKRDSLTDYTKDIPLPLSMGINTSGQPAAIMSYLFNGVTHAERKRRAEEAARTAVGAAVKAGERMEVDV